MFIDMINSAIANNVIKNL